MALQISTAAARKALRLMFLDSDVEHSTSSLAGPPSVRDGVERSAARPTGSGTSRPAGENASKSRGDIADLAASSERRAS